MTAEGIQKNIDVSLSENGESRLTYYSLTDQRDEERWETYHTFLDYEDHRITLPVMAFAALSPLCSLWKSIGNEPNFILNLYGTTGCGKSTLAALTLNFFGDHFTTDAFPGSFRDTAASTEYTGYLLKDVLFVVDNLTPGETKDEETEMKNLLTHLTTLYGDHRLRGRGTYSSERGLGEQKGYPPRGVCMITSERIPDVGNGKVARMLNVSISPSGDRDRSKRQIQYLEGHRSHLNQIMSGYIQYLIRNYDRYCERLPEIFSEWTVKLNTGDFAHGRVINAVGHLQTAFVVWLDFLRDESVITSDEACKASEECWECLLDCAKEHEETMEEHSPCTIFMNAVRDMRDSGKLRIADLSRGTPTYPYIMWEDDAFVYLSMGNVIREVEKHIHEELGCNQRELLRECGEKGYIRMENDKSGKPVRTINKRIGNKVYSVAWFYRDKLFPNDSEEVNTDEGS